MTFVATDSHRLSKKEIFVESSDTFQNIVIPAAACQEIIRLLSLLKEDEVDLEVSNNMIRIVADNVTYSSTLLDGTYPDTSRIIPPAFKHEFNVNRVELEKAIERVNIFKESSVCTISVKDGDMPSLSISSPGMTKRKTETHKKYNDDGKNWRRDYRILQNFYPSFYAYGYIRSRID